MWISPQDILSTYGEELAQLPELIIKHGLVKPEGVFVMEHPKEYDFSALPGFVQRRVYGAVNFSIFQSPILVI